MKIIKYVCLELLLFVSMTLLATATLKIIDMILKLNFDNIWQEGFEVGFLAWIMILVIQIFRRYKKRK